MVDTSAQTKSFRKIQYSKHGIKVLSELEKENSEPYTPPPYNERAVDPDRYHVESGAYNERCVDPELETDPKRIEKYRKTASTAHRESFAARRNSKRRISRTNIRNVIFSHF